MWYACIQHCTTAISCALSACNEWIQNISDTRIASIPVAFKWSFSAQKQSYTRTSPIYRSRSTVRRCVFQHGRASETFPGDCRVQIGLIKKTRRPDDPSFPLRRLNLRQVVDARRYSGWFALHSETTSGDVTASVIHAESRSHRRRSTTRTRRAVNHRMLLTHSACRLLACDVKLRTPAAATAHRRAIDSGQVWSANIPVRC